MCDLFDFYWFCSYLPTIFPLIQYKETSSFIKYLTKVDRSEYEDTTGNDYKMNCLRLCYDVPKIFNVSAYQVFSWAEQIRHFTLFLGRNEHIPAPPLSILQRLNYIILYYSVFLTSGKCLTSPHFFTRVLRTQTIYTITQWKCTTSPKFELTAPVWII